jgi:hypothetical protein
LKWMALVGNMLDILQVEANLLRPSPSGLRICFIGRINGRSSHAIVYANAAS